MKNSRSLPDPLLTALAASLLAAGSAAAQAPAIDTSPGLTVNTPGGTLVAPGYFPQSTAPAPATAPASEAEAPCEPIRIAVEPVNYAPKKKPDPKKPATPPPPPGPAPVPPVPGDVSAVELGDIVVTGDHIDKDATTGLITVTGNPKAVRGTDEIRATRLVINPRTRQFTAEGDVVIVRKGQEFHATRVTYDFVEQEGVAENITSTFQQFYLKAERVLLRPGGVYDYVRAQVTTCDLPKPHWLMHTRSTHVIPGERMIAEGAAVDLLGFRLFTLPRFEKAIGQSDAGAAALFPTLGYDSYNGPFLRKEFELRSKSPAWVFGDVQLNTMHEPSVGVIASTPGQLQVVGSLYYRDYAENQRARHMTVSRVPEVGLVWTSQETPRPGRFLPFQVMGMGVPRDMQLSTKWRFAASLTGGYFFQHHGEDDNFPREHDRDGARFEAQAQAMLPLVKLGPIKLNGLRLMARDAEYDTGQNHAVLGSGIGKHFNIGHFTVGLDRFDQAEYGRTPFMFDDIELKNEWRPKLEYHTKNTNFMYYARIRGSNGGLYDQVIAVSHVFHCLEPRFSYHVRNGEFLLELRIPGFNGFGRSGGSESHSLESGDEDRLSGLSGRPATKSQR